jgi:hypothetical protein
MYEAVGYEEEIMKRDGVMMKKIQEVISNREIVSKANPRLTKLPQRVRST